jgi:hypothetical protein
VRDRLRDIAPATTRPHVRRFGHRTERPNRSRRDRRHAAPYGNVRYGGGAIRAPGSNRDVASCGYTDACTYADACAYTDSCAYTDTDAGATDTCADSDGGAYTDRVSHRETNSGAKADGTSAGGSEDGSRNATKLQRRLGGNRSHQCLGAQGA